MTINNETPTGVPGTLSRGSVSVKGFVVSLTDDEHFVFQIMEDTTLTLPTDEWVFTPSPPRPSAGWYSHPQYPVEEGFSPVWLNSEGEAYTFALGAPGKDGKPKGIALPMPVAWEELVPLEVPHATPA